MKVQSRGWNPDSPPSTGGQWGAGTVLPARVEMGDSEARSGLSPWGRGGTVSSVKMRSKGLAGPSSAPPEHGGSAVAEVASLPQEGLALLSAPLC